MIKIPFQNFPNFPNLYNSPPLLDILQTFFNHYYFDLHLFFKENNLSEITSYRNWLNLSFPLFPILSQHPKIIT